MDSDGGEEEIERINKTINLLSQISENENTEKKQKIQQEGKNLESEECSLERNVPVAGTSDFDNSQEPYHTNKDFQDTKSKKPPKNIKATQSTSPEIPDTKNSQNPKAEMIEDNQMESQFETYKKRSGTGDDGNKYEYLMCGYFALKFSVDQNVIDFKLTTNNEECGNFDDIELTVRFSDKSFHTFLIQLKHFQKNKGVTEKMLQATKGDFRLDKYFESFKEKNLKNRENTTCVLFTNRSSQLKCNSNFSLTHGDVTVKPCENANHLLINTANEESCFHFELHQTQDSSEDVTEFYRRFCLFTNQIKAKESQRRIKEMLKNLLGCNINFVSFMHHWWTNNFVLTKHDVIAKLAELAFAPYIQEIPIRSDKPLSGKSKILKSAIEMFDMTLITTDCANHKVREIWTSESFDEIEINMSKAALKYDLSITEPIDRSKVLWYLSKVPLIVKCEEHAKVRIGKTIKLLETEEKKMKLILLGNHSKEDFKIWKVFGNLFDLQEEDSYNEIIETFKVSLQGRPSISLKQLIHVNQELAKDIKTKELFQMLEEDLLIGKPQADLPQAYIPRTITTFCLDTKQVLDYYISSKNDLLILICNDEMENVIASKITSIQRRHNYNMSDKGNFSSISSMFSQNREEHANRKILEIREFGDSFLQGPFCSTQDPKTLLVSTKQNFTTKEFGMICEKYSRLNIYLLQIIDEERCAMVSSQGKRSQFKEMEYKQKIEEQELFSIFNNSLNVLMGKPGIGKSFLLTSLTRICPSDHWCIRINLIQFIFVFKGKLDHEAILDEILKNNEEQVSEIILDKFKTSRRIYLLLDGLDEMDSDCVNQVLEFIKFISDTGIKVWVSSRENLREETTLQLNVVPIEIQELTETEQINYISERLSSDANLDKKYNNDEVENITSEIFKSVSINHNAKRLLGIPLQLYIITEIFRGKQPAIEFTEDFFVLSKMYRRFFYGKYYHQQAKAEIKCEEAIDDYFDYVLKQFELPALSACLDDETFNKLKLEEKKLEKSRTFLEKIKRKGNKLGIISQVVFEGQKLQAIFYHQSFAEYFACRWLERNFEKLRLIKNEFFKDRYQNLRLIFDIMLAEDKPLHLATIYKNPEQVEKYNNQHNDKDRGGRSALHIICSYSEVVSLSTRNEDETLCVREIFKLLLENYNHCEMDTLFSWDWQKYALSSETLLPFDVILELRNENVNINHLFSHFSVDELLEYCSRFGYLHLLKAIFKNHPDITNKVNTDLIWLLVEKCNESEKECFKNQYVETLKLLTDSSYNNNNNVLNEKIAGSTSLHFACLSSALDVIKILLYNGADINAVTNENATVLHLASRNNKPEVINFLIKKGLQVNQVDIYNWTPLHFACQFNSRDAIEVLLNNGSDINAVTNENATVSHLASRNNKPEIIEFLINKGMEVNQVTMDNLTPLHVACAFNSRDAIEVLLNNGSDINAVTNENVTVLHLASRYNKPEIINFLIKKGLQVNQVDIYNWTPLHFACAFNSRDAIEVLLNNGSDINAVTNENATVLHLASRNNKPEIIEFLINKGMEVNQVTMDNLTPLHVACAFNSRDAIEVLLNNESDVNAVTNGNLTVLHLASGNNKPEIIEFLINKGKEVNQVAMNNLTPLHVACRIGTCDTIKALLKNGADINIVTRQNETVLHLAMMNQNIDVFIFIIAIIIMNVFYNN